VKRKLTDPDVCKMFIVGMCPYEEFQRTKHEVGPCPHIHDEELQAEWQVRALAPHTSAALPGRGRAASRGQFFFPPPYVYYFCCWWARAGPLRTSGRRLPPSASPAGRARGLVSERTCSALGQRLGSTDSGSSGGRWGAARGAQSLDDRSKDRLGFERELLKYLERLMVELRAKKRRNEDRLAADAAIPISAEDEARPPAAAAGVGRQPFRAREAGDRCWLACRWARLQRGIVSAEQLPRLATKPGARLACPKGYHWRRAARTPEGQPRACVRAQAKLAEMNDELQELLTKSEVLGEQGDVDGAQAAAAQVDGLRVRARPLAALPQRFDGPRDSLLPRAGRGEEQGAPAASLCHEWRFSSCVSSRATAAAYMLVWAVCAGQRVFK